MNNQSPLRYPGGKSRACKIIDKIILEHFDLNNFDNLVSPFFGGGSYEFFFQNKTKYKLYVNDKFTPLYNFWKQIQINKNELCYELRKISNITKNDFIYYRNNILDLNNNILQQSIFYFIINRCSFSGSTTSGGFSEDASKNRYTSSSINRIELLDLSNIEIYNYDFEYFLNNYTNDKSLIFLDPPYYLEKKSTLYGNKGDLHLEFDHIKLFNLIQNKQNWIMTYNNCEFIKNLYKNFIIINVNWSYGMNKTKESSEIIIISN